ncbi:hypothetical protein N9M16_09530 [Candidatus Dependentiae bacterium]|nr:hypothetical protein [Candidatus Dependentiae bacterium]
MRVRSGRSRDGVPLFARVVGECTYLVYESALDGCVPQPVPGRDLGELALLLDALLVLRALAVAPGLFARRRPRVLPVVAPRALYLRRWGGAGLRARSPAALADLAHDLAVQDHDP